MKLVLSVVDCENHCFAWVGRYVTEPCCSLFLSVKQHKSASGTKFFAGSALGRTFPMESFTMAQTQYDPGPYLCSSTALSYVTINGIGGQRDSVVAITIIESTFGFRAMFQPSIACIPLSFERRQSYVTKWFLVTQQVALGLQIRAQFGWCILFSRGKLFVMPIEPKSMMLSNYFFNSLTCSLWGHSC